MEKPIVLDRATIVLTMASGMSDETQRKTLARIDTQNVYKQFAKQFERFLEESKIGGVAVHVIH